MQFMDELVHICNVLLLPEKKMSFFGDIECHQHLNSPLLHIYSWLLIVLEINIKTYFIFVYF